MIDSYCLESLLIPVSEGLFLSKSEEENIALLKDYKSLIVFTTDVTIDFGGISTHKYSKIMNTNKAVYIKLEDCIDAMSDDPLNQDYTWPLVFNKYIENMKKGKFFTTKDTWVDRYDKIVSMCDKVSKETNTLVVIGTEEYQYYGSKFAQEHPKVIINSSAVKSFLSSTANSITKNANLISGIHKEFGIRMNAKIPKELFVKNFNLELFHVSDNPNITELQPMITIKRLRNENIRIARISAAPSIDACFRAVGFTLNPGDKPKTYYCYKLLLDKNSRIVKPSTDIVPDQKYTNEYWILDPTKVELLGSITISLDKKTKKIVFDDNKMPTDPLITTSYVKK